MFFSGGVVAFIFLGGFKGEVGLLGAEVEDVFGVLGFMIVASDVGVTNVIGHYCDDFGAGV